MNILDTENTPEIIGNLEAALGTQPGFFISLVAETDWSFVIKVHALIESAFTHLISHTLAISIEDYTSDEFDKSELSRTIAWMELSGKRTGKVALSRSLGLIFDNQIRFISRLSELRNELIHDAKNLSFNFAKYVARLDPNQKKVLIEAFGFAVGSTESIKALLNTELSREEFVLRHPKFAIWLCALMCLSEIECCVSSFTSHRKLVEIHQQKADTLDQLMHVLEPIANMAAANQSPAANTHNNDIGIVRK